MKKLFKGLIIFVVFLVIMIMICVGFILYRIHDNQDDAPYDLYSDDITVEYQLTQIFNQSFDLEDKDYLDITLSEEELNKIIYTIIRKDINHKYDPKSDNLNEKYIKTIEVNTFLGNQKVIIKSAYVQIENNEFGFYVTLRIFGFDTKIVTVATIEHDDNNYYITFKKIGLGKLNLLSGLANNILKEMFNNQINVPNSHITVDYHNKQISLSKDNLNEFLKEELVFSNEDEVLSALFDLLTDPVNGIVEMGIFDNEIGLRFALEKFAVDEESLNVNNLDDFDKDLFIKNKVQNFIFSNLAGSKKITFTDLDFNKIIYDKTNGYEDFTTSFLIPSSSSEIELKIIGIIVNFDEDVNIKVNVDINGLKTMILITGDVYHNDSRNVEIRFTDVITIGQDINEEIGEYLQGNINLILKPLKDNLGSINLIKFEDKSLYLDSHTFTELMKIDDNITPISVDRIKIIEGAIEIYVNIDDSSIIDDIDIVSHGFNSLPLNLFTQDDFFLDHNVNVFLNEYYDFIRDINNNEFNNPDSLISSINNLSIQNQEIVYQKIEERLNINELNNLYYSLFGK